ncbi:DsbA family protein [Rhodohalobacter sp.]|uniref:DsbA family protein n=1 Tax=Rhodohalobacter sp. TaxID=1974210 RepID=UPI002ACE0EA2|nr:DsbA family protein [Rhodohalobacter sp.]MDZ7758125.1 DsbA family protein [Rhodohalobacter sp.]
MNSKITLVYVYDPLCGWCYGFHPVIDKIAKRFKDQLNIRVIPGGLAIDENAQPISEGYDYIRDSLKIVEDKTDVKFGKPFVQLAEDGTYIYDSLPGCKAQNAVNRLAPVQALQFAGAMQSAIFSNGKDLNKLDTYLSILEDFSIDPAEFEAVFTSDEIEKITRDQFDWVHQNNASAFPTLLLEIGNDTGLMSKGYRPYDTVESHLHHLIRNIEKMSS